jgi:hypothetical protein
MIQTATLCLPVSAQAGAERIVAKQVAAREAAVAAKAAREAYAQQQAAKRSREIFESIRRREEVNKKNLFIQAEVQKNIAKAKIPPTVKPRNVEAFNNQANPGIVYRREAEGPYIGQAKHLQRYEVRQTKHARALRKEYGSSYSDPTFGIVAGAPGNNARLLRIAEETALRAERQFSGSVQNKIPAMNAQKFSSALVGGK